MGKANFEGFAPWNGTMQIDIQNENLVARIDGRVAAIVPDLIAVMDSETALPITTESLRYGQRVTIVAVSVPKIMRTREALEVFGPKCFGLSDPYQPIETIGH